jgi:hypothetical protein
MTLSIVRLSISRAVWISLLLVTASAPRWGNPAEPGKAALAPDSGTWAGRRASGQDRRARHHRPASVFLGAADASKFLTLMRNLPRTDAITPSRRKT